MGNATLTLTTTNIVHMYLGSITSRCSGNEPALRPRKDDRLSREGSKTGLERAVKSSLICTPRSLILETDLFREVSDFRLP